MEAGFSPSIISCPCTAYQSALHFNPHETRVRQVSYTLLPSFRPASRPSSFSPSNCWCSDYSFRLPNAYPMGLLPASALRYGLLYGSMASCWVIRPGFFLRYPCVALISVVPGIAVANLFCRGECCYNLFCLHLAVCSGCI